MHCQRIRPIDKDLFGFFYKAHNSSFGNEPFDLTDVRMQLLLYMPVLNLCDAQIVTISLFQIFQYRLCCVSIQMKQTGQYILYFFFLIKFALNTFFFTIGT